MISGQTLRVCREGKPVPTFPDHALVLLSQKVAARAILSVLPLDSFVDKPALRMEIVGRPDEVPPVQIEVQTEIDAAQGYASPMGSIERFAFYELAKRSYCVIQTGERRFYGCFIFKKGVIAPDAA
jgi:L-fucose mutarotase